MQKQLQKKHKKSCSSHEVPFHKTVPIPGCHFSLSDCATEHSICCDIKQESACKVGRSQHVKPRNGVIRVVPQPVCVKAPHFDCNVKVNAKCIKPGTARVQGGDVHIGKQKIVVEVIEPEHECGKPTWKVRCHAPCQEIAPPKIEYCPGKVHFDCEPEVCVVYKKRKHCDDKKRKKPCHDRRH